MQGEKISEDNIERDRPSGKRSRVLRILDDRMEKRHRRASLTRLIFYIIMLIGVILLMLWLRGKQF